MRTLLIASREVMFSQCFAIDYTVDTSDYLTGNDLHFKHFVSLSALVVLIVEILSFVCPYHLTSWKDFQRSDCLVWDSFGSEVGSTLATFGCQHQESVDRAVFMKFHPVIWIFLKVPPSFVELWCLHLFIEIQQVRCELKTLSSPRSTALHHLSTAASSVPNRSVSFLRPRYHHSMC